MCLRHLSRNITTARSMTDFNDWEVENKPLERNVFSRGQSFDVIERWFRTDKRRCSTEDIVHYADKWNGVNTLWCPPPKKNGFNKFHKEFFSMYSIWIGVRFESSTEALLTHTNTSPLSYDSLLWQLTLWAEKPNSQHLARSVTCGLFLSRKRGNLCKPIWS